MIDDNVKAVLSELGVTRYGVVPVSEVVFNEAFRAGDKGTTQTSTFKFLCPTMGLKWPFMAGPFSVCWSGWKTGGRVRSSK